MTCAVFTFETFHRAGRAFLESCRQNEPFLQIRVAVLEKLTEANVLPELSKRNAENRWLAMVKEPQLPSGIEVPLGRRGRDGRWKTIDLRFQAICDGQWSLAQRGGRCLC